jgi:pimeloyl-ACP methyl ester carboxylesterase
VSEQHLTAISVDDVSIQYTLQGTGSIGLIFVHGAWGNKTHWQAQIEHFSPKYTSVAIDMAGHGGSSIGNRQAFTMGSFGYDVRAVVDQLGLEQVVLIGHSLGGAVILEAERLMPERVLGVIGVDTFIYGPYQEVKEEQIESTKTNYQKDFSNKIYDLYRSLFHPDTNPDLAEHVSKGAGKTSPHVGLSELEELLRWNVRETLSEVQSSIQCISSAWSFENNTTTLYPEYFDIKFMSGVGHFVMLEDTQTFNRLLEELLEKL